MQNKMVFHSLLSFTLLDLDVLFRNQRRNRIRSSRITVINQEQLLDPIQTILDDHKHHIGYYRMMPTRPVLIPHKVSFDNVFGDQSHLTVNRPIPAEHHHIPAARCIYPISIIIDIIYKKWNSFNYYLRSWFVRSKFIKNTNDSFPDHFPRLQIRLQVLLMH